MNLHDVFPNGFTISGIVEDEENHILFNPEDYNRLESLQMDYDIGGYALSSREINSSNKHLLTTNGYKKIVDLEKTYESIENAINYTFFGLVIATIVILLVLSSVLTTAARSAYILLRVSGIKKTVLLR